MRKNVNETWPKVNGNKSFSDAAFIAVTALSITLFSAETWNAVGASFLHPVYALGTCCARAAAEDLYQVRGAVAPILRERCDKVTLRNWLLRGERVAGAEGKLSPGEPRFPFSPLLRLILPSFRLLNPTRSYFVPELLLDDFFFLLHFKRARCYFARRRSEEGKESKVYTKSGEKESYTVVILSREKYGAIRTLLPRYRDYCVTVSALSSF